MKNIAIKVPEEIRKSFMHIRYRVKSTTISIARRVKSFPSLPMFDERWDSMSPNIDQNS